MDHALFTNNLFFTPIQFVCLCRSSLGYRTFPAFSVIVSDKLDKMLTGHIFPTMFFRTLIVTLLTDVSKRNIIILLLMKFMLKYFKHFLKMIVMSKYDDSFLRLTLIY